MPEPLYRLTFDSATLLRDHPPQFRHPHKSLLFDLAFTGLPASSTQIEITRWPAHIEDPLTLSPSLPADVLPNFYDYTPVASTSPSLEWHVNFADPRLFVAYGSPLFAQDEMQVAEHPALASVRECLLARNLPAKTVDDAGNPTPILVRNVQRRLSISTAPTPRNPQGLYGNRFAQASPATISRATTIIDPPTITNLIAMAAPSGGTGPYTPDDIEYILTTALTAFSAARHETLRALGPSAQTLVHTGFWGCGAFGGNRTLMTALQSLAARAAHIERLIVHSGDDFDSIDAWDGLACATNLSLRLGPSCPVPTLISHLTRLNFEWGTSDGN